MSAYQPHLPSQPEAALAAARKALRRAPHLLEVRHAYAAALLANGRASTACEALAAAAALAPADAPTRRLLGEARLADGRPRDALGALLRALRLDPADEPAALAAAHIYRLLHRADKAIALLRGFLATSPAAQNARLELARNLIDTGQKPAALAVLAAAPLPLHGEAAFAFALLRRLADPPAGGTPPPLRQDQPWPLWHHRELLRTAERAGEAQLRDAMARVQARMAGNAPLDDRIAANFTLSRYWFGLEEADAAFACLRAGHGMLSAFEPFDRAAPTRLGAAMAELFTPEFLHAGTPPKDPAAVFILGMPRSGTTLAEQILAAHGSVFGAGERHALGELARALAGPRRDPAWAHRIATLPPARLDEAAAGYLEALHALAPGAARIVDKMPSNFQLLGLAARLFPGARFIHCVRDPRDIGFSIYARRFEAAHAYAHSLDDLGWYIAWQDQLMRHWKHALPGRILTLRLHEWIRDFNRTLARVLDFLELPPDAACARFFELDREVKTASRLQVRRPVNDEGMGRWRRYQAQLMPLIEALRREGALK